jgi:predicted amidohydrolase
VAGCAAAGEELEQAGRSLGVRIAYGTAERHGGALRNLIVITEPGRPGAGGRTVYAKTHMVAAERAVFTPGTDLVLTEDGRLALGCCYDLAFPDVCARLAEAGFEGVGAARAIENVAYVVCANQAGTMGLTRFHGGSRIVDPLGRTRLEMGDTVGVAAADLNLDWVSRLRSSADAVTYPLLDDRQPPMPVRRGSAR